MTGEDRRPDADAESTDSGDSSGDERKRRPEETPTEPTERSDSAPDSGSSVTSADSTMSAEPEASAMSTESVDTAEPLWRRFVTATDGPLVLLREICVSFTIVLVIGGILFGISGVWPPMVAVESESMEPNINQYDLVFVTDPGRFSPAEADQLGVVTADSVDDTEYESFNAGGSVVVFDNPESHGPPIIHRAHFFVEENENWYDRANPEYVSASDCDELQHCPAPHDGYITKGDNDASNAQYDQANGIAPVVRSEWVQGVARLRIPYIGYVRLALTGAASSSPLLPIGLGAIGASSAYAIGRRDLLQ